MNSFISWIGGKKLLRKQIISQFPKEMDRYILERQKAVN